MDWRQRASCRNEDPELFFPVGTSGPALLQVAEAKAVCQSCPVADECLMFALRNGADAGVWGGLSEDERRELARRVGVEQRGAQRRCAGPGCEEPIPPPKAQGRVAKYCGYTCRRRAVQAAERERERARRRGEAS
ncbi:MAG: WhiB family transcriptional regulator [Pseudonocardia sp.]|nr:WhiB family transcriptional regulator [Pseudonocardia sp.]